MITPEQEADIKRYVKSLNLGVPNAAVQQLIVNIFRHYQARDEE
ncbi:Uncharacterised protein [Mycobacteroides abscessus subsp. abscessus]|nr:hypothetical protein [Mycobacteroides abscessus]MDM2350233.1 hypothetical protein [Mycobacteroides abscessus]MDM2356836.1 hypothetical protein [Mycobacteroides abscessus]SHU59036.1 Uncharacterised protein [Mycobacteroides abscessus subsp. abscessus]SIH26230.1 Uncharacterised protein [Mycobacteroides abscessus subsp. abscessus]SIH35915.1 Uncharacterised protein [Mycobacteroides abscessus subsp. abscessus]